MTKYSTSFNKTIHKFLSDNSPVGTFTEQFRNHSFRQMFPKGLEKVPKNVSDRNSPETAPKQPRNSSETAPKQPRSGSEAAPNSPEAAPKQLRNGLETAPKQPRNGPETAPKRPRNDSGNGPEKHRTSSKNIPNGSENAPKLFRNGSKRSKKLPEVKPDSPKIKRSKLTSSTFQKRAHIISPTDPW